MNPRGRKLKPKRGINMPFSEVVERLQTDAKEVETSIEKAKQKKPAAERKPQSPRKAKQALRSR
jgi:hypothetical protein